MNHPLETPEGPTAPRVYSVSELNRLVKALLERHYPAVWVEGEVSNLRIPASGHAYFTLKDPGGQISAVMFRGDLGRLRFRVQDGLHIVLCGELSVYEARGQYQIIARSAFPRGVGALQAAFEQLKKKLQAEGLFAEERKRPLPALPRRIGLVTSPTGAAIRDFLTVLRRRFPNLAILIDPVRVQGDQAAAEIVAALDAFNARRDVDVIIVTRGGGSLEDLWPFNEEIVARAIARSAIPVVSAVGHEIDFTIADFVADLRVPTPTAAAELVVGRKDELSDRIRLAAERLRTNLRTRLQLLRTRLNAAAGSYVFREPANAVRQYQQRIDDLIYRLEANARRALRDARARIDKGRASLAALSPLAVLDRGYAILFRSADGRVLRAANEAAPGDLVTARLHRGRLHAKVESTEEGDPSDETG